MSSCSSLFTEIWMFLERISSKDSAQLGIIKLQLCLQVLNIVHVGAY